MRLPGRLLAITTVLFGASLAAASGAAADDAHPRVAAAELGGADAFPGHGKLNDAELKAVSGLGADPAGDAKAPEGSDVSVILFDELGRPKRPDLPPGNGSSSTVIRSVNVQVGR